MTTPKRKPITVQTLRRMKADGDRIACLTCYDASFSRLLERAGIDIILVGDSLGMVIQGQASTVPVTMDHMVYHTRAVAAGNPSALLIADMPFMSYATTGQALTNAARLMSEGLAQMVKLEGGSIQAQTVRELTERGIPVCAHVGLQPQSVHKLGGYRVQGREPGAAERMLADAVALDEAGADLLILECVPVGLAEAITQRVSMPVVGIGAGGRCDGQVLVLYDILGISAGHIPRFVADFMTDASDVEAAIRAFVAAVKDGRFPGPEHGFD